MCTLCDNWELAVFANELGIAGLWLAVVVVFVATGVTANAVVLTRVVRARIGKAEIFVSFSNFGSW